MGRRRVVLSFALAALGLAAVALAWAGAGSGGAYALVVQSLVAAVALPAVGAWLAARERSVDPGNDGWLPSIALAVNLAVLALAVSLPVRAWS